MSKQNRAWAKAFNGTAKDFIQQAQGRKFTDKSIKHWVKYNWNINLTKGVQNELTFRV